MALIATVAALIAGPADHAGPCRPVDCINQAAVRWHVSAPMLRRKAWCESRMRPGAYNASSGAAGLFQFLPSTWRTTPYRWHSIWSPRWSSLAAAWMHHVGRGGEWACR